MGKSPGKWLKTLLFGKKSFRSSSTKRKDSLKSSNEKEYNNDKGKEAALSENSPIISDPILINTYNSSIIPTIEDSKSSNLESILPDNINPVIENKLDLRNNISSNNHDEVRENKAATIAQAAIRGFWAFRALKGIIRLQGLVRGHLVRRQAISTLYAMNGIIKLQALARGRIIRRSDLGIQINYSKIYQQNSLGCKSANAWKENFSKSSFGYNLISSEIGFRPPKIQFEKTDPNSVFSWLERWEKTQFGKPISKPKISISSKPKSKKSNSATQTKPFKAKKQISIKNQALNSQPEKSTKITTNSELEKPKTNPRRFSLSPSTENPKQNPKKPLRKVSNSMSEAEIGKLSADLKKTQIKDSSFDTPLKTVPDVDLSENSLSSNGDSSSKLHSRRSSISSKLTPKENLVSTGESSAKQSSRRRSSVSVGLEIQENESNNTSASRTVPSYMATTASSKARNKSQVSPRVVAAASPDSEGKNGILRRHSLPTSNGKMKSVSPRAQKPVQSGTKGLVKGERSLTLSRDGSEKMINAEWRR